jgi:exodeoxyribonuclease VII large subunit
MSERVNNIRLSELTRQIQDVIDQNFNNINCWVIADITNHSFKEKTNYHYFDFVEKAEDSNKLVAKIAGKAWGSGSKKIREFERITGQRFTNNINVLVRVKVTYHIEFGLSLEILDIDTNFTISLLEQQRQETLTKLLENYPDIISKIGDKYSTRNSRLQLPAVIQRIAVVASKTSAGNEDFKHTLINNPYGFKFHIDDYHTVVQNDADAQQFFDRLIDVFKSNIKYDVVVINRGGGAQTDFLIFDNYKIGLAVAKFPIPIITGIGHHKNETITDLMAHTQTKTPTKAAEFIITHNKHYEDSILNYQKTILIKTQQTISVHFQRIIQLNTFIINKSRTFLNHFKDGLVINNQIIINNTKTLLYKKNNSLSLVGASIITKPRIITSNKLNNLDNIKLHFLSFSNAFIKNNRGYLNHYISVINMMAPDNILKKGFAVIKYNGEITSNPDIIATNTEMEVILIGKSIKSIVKSKSNHDGKDFNI